MIFRRAAVLAAFAVICAAASVQGEPEQFQTSAITVVDVSRDVEEATEAQQALVKAEVVTEKLRKVSNASLKTFAVLMPILLGFQTIMYACNKAGQAAPANPETGAGELGKMAAA
eukprot:GHVT01030997.1.p2 GENE.GHVT01030997.1~~GHVT01030997.1.p2  ORF type:complete len:115 (+),score=22.87 GHVT01030997.1:481-825(+)